MGGRAAFREKAGESAQKARRSASCGGKKRDAPAHLCRSRPRPQLFVRDDAARESTAMPLRRPGFRRETPHGLRAVRAERNALHVCLRAARGSSKAESAAPQPYAFAPNPALMQVRLYKFAHRRTCRVERPSARSKLRTCASSPIGELAELSAPALAPSSALAQVRLSANLQS